MRTRRASRKRWTGPFRENETGEGEKIETSKILEGNARLLSTTTTYYYYYHHYYYYYYYYYSTHRSSWFQGPNSELVILGDFPLSRSFRSGRAYRGAPPSWRAYKYFLNLS